MKKINCILLIDDNPADNEFNKIIISKANICNHIKIAESGLEGLKYIMNSAKKGNENEFPKADLILLDINMTGMNGFEFLFKYYQLPKEIRAHAAISILSASSKPDVWESSDKIQKVPLFLCKPLTVEMIQSVYEKYF